MRRAQMEIAPPEKGERRFIVNRPDTSVWQDSSAASWRSRFPPTAGCFLAAEVTSAGVDSLKVLFEPFEDRFHRFIRPFPIHIEVDAAF
jgi:hypothetical protein